MNYLFFSAKLLHTDQKIYPVAFKVDLDNKAMGLKGPGSIIMALENNPFCQGIQQITEQEYNLLISGEQPAIVFTTYGKARKAKIEFNQENVNDDNPLGFRVMQEGHADNDGEYIPNGNRSNGQQPVRKRLRTIRNR